MSETKDRVKALDVVGLTVQVLSYPSAGADLLPPREALQWSKDMNDTIASRIAGHPSRYAGLAHLPLTDPEASADELDRAVSQLGFKGALVSGATDGRYLDHPSFEPLLARAEHLDISACRMTHWNSHRSRDLSGDDSPRSMRPYPDWSKSESTQCSFAVMVKLKERFGAETGIEPASPRGFRAGRFGPVKLFGDIGATKKPLGGGLCSGFEWTLQNYIYLISVRFLAKI